MNELFGLLADSGDHFGDAVSCILTSDTAGEVQLAVSIDVLNRRAVSAPDENGERGCDAPRDTRFAPLLEFPRNRARNGCNETDG